MVDTLQPEHTLNRFGTEVPVERRHSAGLARGEAAGAERTVRSH